MYALPRTVVDVELTIQRTSKKPGRFWELTDLFFPDYNPVDGQCKHKPNNKRGEQVSFEIKSAMIDTFGEPDPDHVYYLKIHGKRALKQTAEFQFTEAGAVTGLKASVENQTSDVILTSLGAVSGMLNKTLFRASRDLTSKSLDDCKAKGKWDSSVSFQCYVRDPVYPEIGLNFDQLEPSCDEDDTKTCQADLERWFNKYPEKKERMVAAKKIYEAIAGKIVEQYRPQSEISGAVNRFISVWFSGERKSETWSGNFHLYPAEKPSASNIKAPDTLSVLSFSKRDGICNPDKLTNYTGAPPPAKFGKDSENCDDIEITFDLASDQLARIYKYNFVDPPDSDATGFRYRVPGEATASVIWKNGKEDVVLNQATIQVAQFGVIAALPADLGGKAALMDMTFYESTGALKGFTLTSEPLITHGIVDSTLSPLNELLEARKTQHENAAKESDQLNRRERRRKLLEERNKILNLCATLQIDPCEVP